MLNLHPKNSYRYQSSYDRYTKTGYVSIGGYVFSTKTLEQILYEQNIAKYENKIKSQIAKIMGYEPNDKNPDVERGLKIMKNMKGGMVGVPPEGKEDTFYIRWYKISKDYINEGVRDIKAGNRVKGLAKIGTGGSWIWALEGVLFSELVENLWPEGVELEDFYEKNVTNQSF